MAKLNITIRFDDDTDSELPAAIQAIPPGQRNAQLKRVLEFGFRLREAPAVAGSAGPRRDTMQVGPRTQAAIDTMIATLTPEEIASLTAEGAKSPVYEKFVTSSRETYWAEAVVIELQESQRSSNPT